MSFASARCLALALGCLAAVLSGCAPESRELAVDLQTDFVPGVEFDLVTGTLVAGGPEGTGAPLANPWDTPVVPRSTRGRWSSTSPPNDASAHAA